MAAGMYIALGDGFDPAKKHSAECGSLRQHALAAAAAVASSLVLAAASCAVYDALSPLQQRKAARAALLASIPVVALFFTWFHIWLAIQMLFRPVKFFGIWQYRDTGLGLGWQGVVPRKSLKMARTAFACARAYLQGPREWFKKVDPKLLVSHTRPHLRRIVSSALSEVVQRRFPDLERKMPLQVREELTTAALEQIEDMSPSFWGEVTELLCDRDRGIDNDGMVVNVFQENKELLNHFFLSLGGKEFRFIEKCGAALGFICGFVQLWAYGWLDEEGRVLFLPLTGFFLGIFTNWLAIQMCFKPCHPRPFPSARWRLFDIQGLFLKRQRDVAYLYSKMLTEHFFEFNKVIAYLQTCPELWAQLRQTYMQHNSKVLRQTLGLPGLWLGPLALGQAEFRALKQDLSDAIAASIAEADELHAVAGRFIADATDVFRSNAEAMANMPPDLFERLLHPVFQEDEWILVLLGGVLGAIVGLAQVHFLKE